MTTIANTDPTALADGAWMLLAAAMVLLMTPALALFYGGMSREKSVLNMMMMSFGAIAVVSVVYVLWGWAASFGPDDLGGVVSNPVGGFALHGVIRPDGGFVAGTHGYPAIIDVCFQAAFAIVTVALISGAIAERVRFSTWLVFAGLWVTLVYVPVSHMVWGAEGLISGGAHGIAAHLFGTVTDAAGAVTAAVAPVDFAGGAVVEANSGMAGLVLALVVGHRVGFGHTAYRPHNLPFVMLGAGLLWFGWFGFNAASATRADGSAGLVWINTLLAGAVAMGTFVGVERLRDGHATSFGAASGVVAGLVAITPSCSAVSPLGAMVVGGVAGALCAWAIGLKHRWGIDDSLDVVGVHMVGGIWGTLSIGLLATGTFGTSAGVLYSPGAGWRLLVLQVVVVACVLAASAVGTLVIALALRPVGWRVDREDEHHGIDERHHAETAYDSGRGMFG